MNVNEFSSEVLVTFQLEPTMDQAGAIAMFAQFMFSDDSQPLMLLCGSAGTGKTTLAAAMVNTLHRLGLRVVLLAPTGRAAKVFALNAGLPANTIHRKIYRQGTFEGVDTLFELADNRNRNTLFVVDEASMIANQSSSHDIFGSGCLLDDLIQYVYSGVNCSLMLIGDTAQLPPVGLQESPALQPELLAQYGLTIYHATMDEVLRQSKHSGILTNATTIRHIDVNGIDIIPRIRLGNFTDVKVVTGSELIEYISGSYSKVGIDETMVVTRSNKRANRYNYGIRGTILGREAELTVGDRVMIVKNNYYWTEQARDKQQNGTNSDDDDSNGSAIPDFLANGDIAIVRRAGKFIDIYGFHFAMVTLEFPDYDDYEITTRVILDSLDAEAPALSYDQQQQLFTAILKDYEHIRNKKKRMLAVRDDQFYNALQVKFTYAITCHKAQGGQWQHVYIDQGYIAGDMYDYDYLHWLYTAFTRATQQLFLVNWPTYQIE